MVEMDGFLLGQTRDREIETSPLLYPHPSISSNFLGLLSRWNENKDTDNGILVFNLI